MGNKPDGRLLPVRVWLRHMSLLFKSVRKRAEVEINVGLIALNGYLEIPKQSYGLVLFAHGSGSDRDSPRNQQTAAALRKQRLATLLFDLLTEEEKRDDVETEEVRFDVDFLASRMRMVTDWALNNAGLTGLPLGYFGASTGAAAALTAAAEEWDSVRAVVSRGGRPDLASEALGRVSAPTLLIVGEKDLSVLKHNREALDQLRPEKRLEVVPGAGHLFEEPGTLDSASQLAAAWFAEHLPEKIEDKHP